ncbi:MAG TPA: hypothetical protein VN578_23755 [Candidatus Binatia bacterium]|jgi:hypothetical protein|nr:hypothetical protein [Candidatus Binatia bacterium]
MAVHHLVVSSAHPQTFQPRIDTSRHVFLANDQLATRFIEEIDFHYCALDATAVIMTASLLNGIAELLPAASSIIHHPSSGPRYALRKGFAPLGSLLR